jgi:hypothetical protein
MPAPLYGEVTASSANIYGRFSWNETLPTLTVAKCDQIASDPVVKFALSFMVMPIRHLKWNVTGTDQEQIDFVTDALDRVLADYLAKAAAARKYGFAGFEIIYVPRADGRIGLGTLKLLEASKTEVLENKVGRFLGLRYTQVTGGWTELPVQTGKCLLLTNRRSETQDRYGISELVECADAWQDWRFVNGMMLRYIEVCSKPGKRGLYRADMLKSATPDVDTLAMLDSMLRGKNVAIPMDKDRMPLFERALQFKDTQKLRALLVPERALTQDVAVGSNSMADTHAGFLRQAQQQVASWMLDAISTYVLPRLLAFNFLDPDGTIRIEAEGFEDRDNDLQRDVIGKILSTPYFTPEVAEWLSDRTGIPIEAKEIAPPPAPVIVAPIVPEKGKEQEAVPPEEVKPEVKPADVMSQFSDPDCRNDKIPDGMTTVGYRYGKAPESGFSYNSREQKYEKGVSMASAGGVDEVGSFAADAQGRRYW